MSDQTCDAQGAMRYGHGHTCSGDHRGAGDMHWCPLCRKWWWYEQTSTYSEG